MSKWEKFLTEYRRVKKTVAAVVGAVVAFATLVVLSPSAEITSAEYLSGFIGLVTAIGVYSASNTTAD